MAVFLHKEVWSHTVSSAASAPALAASPPSLGQSRAVLALPFLRGVGHSFGALQHFQVVFLVLHLPTSSQGSADVLL